MSRAEIGMVLLHEQQMPQGHRSLEDYAGVTIAQQTHTLLELFRRGEIRRSKIARNFLKGETADYLREAQKGSFSLFNWRGLLFEDIDLTIGDAAHHAFVVFTALPTYGMEQRPEIEKIVRKNALQAPKTRGVFLERLAELKMGVWQVAEGQIPPGIFPQSPVLFRTCEFFRVASELPLAS